MADRQPGPQAGRRAGRRAGNVEADSASAAVGFGDEPAKRPDAGGENATEPSSPDGPQFGRRKGGAASGWGEPAATEGGEPAPAPAPIPPPRKDSSDDDDGVAAFIPDLEEEEVEEQIRQVSEAPVTQHQMQSIDELDNGADAAGALQMVDGGIDLSLLTGCLSSRQHVEEPDTPWDFAGVLTEVSQKLQAEEDKENKEEAEADDAGKG